MLEELLNTPDFQKAAKKAKLLGIDLESAIKKADDSVLPKLISEIVELASAKVIAQMPAQETAQPVDIQEIVKQVIAQLPQSQPVDIKEIVKEVLVNLPPPGDIDEEALVQKAALKLVDRLNAFQQQFETPIAKLQEAMLILNQNLKTLQENQPKLIQQQVNTIVGANAESLKQTINQEMEKIKETLQSQADAGAASGSPLNGMGAVAAVAIENSEKVTSILASIADVIKAFKGSPAAVATDVNSLVRGLTLGERIAKGQLSMAELAKEMVPGPPPA